MVKNDYKEIPDLLLPTRLIPPHPTVKSPFITNSDLSGNDNGFSARKTSLGKTPDMCFVYNTNGL